MVPDVAYLSGSQLLKDDEDLQIPRTAPDVVVEVISSGDWQSGTGRFVP